MKKQSEACQVNNILEYIELKEYLANKFIRTGAERMKINENRKLT